MKFRCPGDGRLFRVLCLLKGAIKAQTANGINVQQKTSGSQKRFSWTLIVLKKAKEGKGCLSLHGADDLR